MSFEWSISLGSLIIAGTNVLTLALVAWRVTRRFIEMERRVNLMFAWFLRQIAGKTDAVTANEIRDFFGVARDPGGE